jgi:membrane protein required for colicin V production
MNILDIIIIILLIFLIVRGVMRGFVGEVASLAGVILGFWLAVRFMADLNEYLKPNFPDLSILPIICFALIFLAALVVCNLIGWGLKLLFKKTALGWIDRILGGGLAVLKGVLIAYFAIVILTIYLPVGTPFIARSKLSPVVIKSFQAIKDAVMPTLAREWERRFKGKDLDTLKEKILTKESKANEQK